MDPLTAAFNTLTAALGLVTKVFDAADAAHKVAQADKLAEVGTNILAFVTGLQEKINASVK